MAVARQHNAISMHLVGHPLTYSIDTRFHCERGALEDFGLVSCGEELPDVLRDLRGHIGFGRWGGPARDLLPNTSVPFS